MKVRNPLVVTLWTFGLFVLGNMVLYPSFLVSASRLGVSFGDIASGAIETPETIFVKGIIGLVLGVPFVVLIVRFLWRRDVDWVGFRFSGKTWFTGACAGIATGCTAMGLLMLIGSGRITSGPARIPASELVLALIGIVTWGFFKTLLEEAVFRGMATREYAHRWNWPVATIVGGLYFGGCHLIGLLPILTVPLAIAILAAAVVVNVLFVILFLRGGSLSLPWGFHFGWNLALTAVFGTVMSGEDQSFGLWHVEMSGSPLLTGGQFGPELSIVSLGLFGVLSLVLLWGLRPKDPNSRPISKTGASKLQD